MKKSLIIAVAALIGIAAFAQTNVTSANVVGYVKKGTPADGLSIQGVPFLGTNTAVVADLFGDTMPLGTEVIIFKDGGYLFETYAEQLGPPPFFPVLGTNWTPNTVLIDGDQGFWVKLPSGSSNTTNLFSGDVVDHSSTITIQPGFNLVHYPYSAGTLLSDTALSTAATVGDEIYVWNAASQGYTTISVYQETLGPPPFFPILGTNWTIDVSLDLGDGFWYDSQASTTNVIVETQPYTL